MLLATASYALPCHASNSSGNSNSKTQKLSRTINQSSQKSSTATTTAALMKTIAVRANRNGGFSNDASVQKTQQQHQSSSHSKANASANTLITNDNLKKTVVASFYVTSSKNLATKYDAKSSTSAITASSSNSVSASLKATVPTASFLKTYTVPPTTLHRSPKDRLRSCSIDSLHDEMCHFKPIRTLPLTPLKSGTHSRGFSLKAPKPSLLTNSMNCDFSAIKRVVNRENLREKRKPTRRNDSRQSSNIFQSMKPHLSAFVRLQPNAWIELQEISANFSTSSKHDKVPKKNTQKINESKTKIQKTKSKQVKTNAKQKSKMKTKTTTTTNTNITKITATTATNKVANNEISTNSRKRKAQTNLKQNEVKIETKKRKKVADKTKSASTNRKTPPLTRGRRRLEGNDVRLIEPIV